MNLKRISIFSTLIICILSLVFILTNNLTKTAKYKPNQTSFSKKLNRIDGAVKYLASIRNNQITGELPYKDVYKAMEDINKMPKNKSANNLSWQEMGPDNVGGRTRAIHFDINNPNIIWAAGVSGGLYKSVTGGSSWKRVPLRTGKSFDEYESLIISSITQLKNGTIFIGTGEQLAAGSGNGSNTGFPGKGVFISKDTVNFTLLNSTKQWVFVNDMTCNTEKGWIFAANNDALYLSKDTGKTWVIPVKYPGSAIYKGRATDVDYLADGTVVTSTNNTGFISSSGGDVGTFTRMYSGLPGATTLTRIEFAVAPSNTNYIYALAAATNGHLEGVYRSEDKGKTWSLIGPGGSANFLIFGSNGQGWYDNEIAVFSDNPNRILIGGVNMWEWELGKTWKLKSSGWPIHSDIHKIIFHPKNPKIYYVGSDGGISRTLDAGETFVDINKNYNITQFYTLAVSGKGELMGGTQDNSTPFIPKTGNTTQAATILWGGDGGNCSFSLIKPEALFVSSQEGNAGRTPITTPFPTWQEPLDWYSGSYEKKTGMLGLGIDDNSDGKPDRYPVAFITPLLLWETFNDKYTRDYVTYTADKNYTAGTTVTPRSKNNAYPFDYVLKKNLSKDDTIKVKDIIQSKYFLGFGYMIWMTRNALDFSATPKWYKIANIPEGITKNLSISRDGNHLWVGTYGGIIYRVSNIRLAYDSATSDVNSKYCVIATDKIARTEFKNRPITSIYIDPNDNNHVIVTLGNYGNTIYIYESTNALAAEPEFKSKQGNLPKMPVYSSIIEMNSSKTIIIGTEYGTYMTTNISSASPIWVEINEGIERVPTFALYQQIYDYSGDYVPTNDPFTPFVKASEAPQYKVNNYGMIYAATHGRGIFQSDKFMGINDRNTSKSNPVSINIYPNPANEIINITNNFNKNDELNINIYDLSGKLVKTFTNINHTDSSALQINVSSLLTGTYIVNIRSANKSASTKLNILK
ncbi:MAG: T9SS type A sorting domain-containing protein [Bacteroidales bacterium]|nr:T9SS type A sorting domain-containing protein [Bacteroidales bacterium]